VLKRYDGQCRIILEEHKIATDSEGSIIYDKDKKGIGGSARSESQGGKKKLAVNIGISNGPRLSAARLEGRRSGGAQ